MTQPGQTSVDMARLVEELRLIGHPMGPVLISQQLALLRKAGLVQTRREAKQVFYRLADGRLGNVIASLSEIVGPVQSLVSRSPAVTPISRGVSAAMFARVEPRA